MMQAQILFLASITALGIATFTDLKKRIVPDKLTYTAIAIGLLLQLFFAITTSSQWAFITALGTTTTTFICAYSLWKMGVWAGGDVKLFTALAALNPTNHAIIRDALGIQSPLFNTITLPIFPLTLFVLSILSMLPIAMIMTISAVMKKKELQKKILQDIGPKTKNALISSAAITGTLFATNHFNQPAILAIPALIVLGLLGKKTSTAIGAALFFAAIAFQGITAAQQFVALFFGIISLFAAIKLYFLAKTDILTEKVKINELKEGMISAVLIVKENGKAKETEPVSIKTVINHFRNNSVASLQDLISPKGVVLASPQSAGGLTEEQITQLKQAAKNGEIKEALPVKKSVPFVPAVLAGYLIAQTVGDIFWSVVF